MKACTDSLRAFTVRKNRVHSSVLIRVVFGFNDDRAACDNLVSLAANPFGTCTRQPTFSHPEVPVCFAGPLAMSATEV